MHQSGDGSPPMPARPSAPSPEQKGLDVGTGFDPAPPDQNVPDSPQDEDRRPTPVRMAMEGGEEGDKEAEGRPRVVEDPESGIRWVVAVRGRSVGGILPLRNVPLMELSFAMEEAPTEPLKTVLCHGKDLSEVPDQDLLAGLRNSGPFRETMRIPEDRDRKVGRPRGGRSPRG